MPHFLGEPEFWVAVAFVIFVALIWKPASRAIVSALDARASRIEKELNQAASLREEAQALLAQYQRKQRDAIKQADEILEHARVEAERLSRQAAKDLEATLARREKLAMQRIAQAEQQAVVEVRAAAVDVAIAAAEKLLAEKIDAGKADALIDQAIRQLPAKLH
jgi:F-type H+-transporting ATPase subunit b